MNLRKILTDIYLKWLVSIPTKTNINIASTGSATNIIGYESILLQSESRGTIQRRCFGIAGQQRQQQCSRSYDSIPVAFRAFSPEHY